LEPALFALSLVKRICWKLLGCFELRLRGIRAVCASLPGEKNEYNHVGIFVRDVSGVFHESQVGESVVVASEEREKQIP
jgi:hypothetical protein